MEDHNPLSNIKLLRVSFLLPYVPGAFERLVDSGSSDCFMEPDFATKNRLSYQEIASFPVALMDGTISTYVTSAILLPIELTCCKGIS